MQDKMIGEGITFDDVLLVPARSIGRARARWTPPRS